MQFRFIKYNFIWFTFSVLILALGVGAMVFHQIKTGSFLNFGIDFTGGSLVEYQFEKGSEILPTELKETLDQQFPGKVNQVTSTGNGTHLVQARNFSEEELTAVNAFLKKTYGSFELLRSTSIGPKVGETLKKRAFMAIGIALIAIILYITYAFRHVPQRVSSWRFGWCAIIAMFYNVLATVGFFAFIGYEVDSLFITALLTVMGFSVHDTITVFDRIRENLKFQFRGQTFSDIADISLNQTLVRSLNTGLCTLFTLVALLFFGAQSLRPFMLAMLFGILIGTYSSIFLATPLLTLWQEWRRAR
ncbi:MAG: protein translocase subunit SecF [Candidatus Peregrinibacteria bacterium]